MNASLPASAFHPKAISLWLFVCCALIFAMVVLGGVTRLTGSGLSMVEWDPIFGVIPPRSDAEWQQVFAGYQQSPEYQKVNVGMSLEEFKTIYCFEYAHRLLGRSIGLAFLVPFLYFWLRRRIPPGLTSKLLAIFILGGLQGLLGWYMVKSGLVDDPRVSPYRLAAHLLLAFIIYGYILWVALDLLSPSAGNRPEPAPGDPLRWLALGVLLWLGATVAYGAFVAGLDAGLAYNTFPLMGDRLVPAGMFALEPTYRNWFENVATVQFVHRWLATSLLALIVILWLLARAKPLSPRARTALHLLVALAFVQVGLGISTLLLHVPIPLASAHQAGALALFSVMLFFTHELHRAPAR
jgi:cytochrome c oxidase assembly protein subunit 15